MNVLWFLGDIVTHHVISSSYKSIVTHAYMHMYACI